MKGHAAKIGAIARKMAKSVSRRDPNDSESVREYSRTDENGRKFYHYPEGTYHKKGERYLRDTEAKRGIIHG